MSYIHVNGRVSEAVEQTNVALEIRLKAVKKPSLRCYFSRAGNAQVSLKRDEIQPRLLEQRPSSRDDSESLSVITLNVPLHRYGTHDEPIYWM